MEAKLDRHKILMNWREKWPTFVFWIAWPIVVFYGVQLVAGFLLQVFLGDRLDALIDSAVFQTGVSAVLFVLIFLGVYLLPIKMLNIKITREDLGLTGTPTWSDIGLGITGLIVALLLSGTLTAIVANFVEFDLDQAQDLGYDNISQTYQYILAFVSLVVVAPIAEELIFRGVLQSQLRQFGPALAIFVVSIMFGIAHGQWNVAIVTFAMGVVMSFIREKLTGTIWASIILHMLKNAIAFFLLFMVPDYMELIQ